MRIGTGLDALYALERYSAKDNAFTRLHPGVKLAVTACYLVCIASFGRHSLSALMPFVLYPVLVQTLAELPLRLFRTQFLTALPFCAFAALSTLLFERETLFVLGGVAVPGGAVAFCVILIKTLLCVWAVLLLTATTPMRALSAQLLRWHVPQPLVLQLGMTYRYLFLLVGEASRMQKAYRLRGGGKKGITVQRMGSFLGTLLLRSARHAQTVENAMLCRGYAADTPAQRGTRPPAAQLAGAAALCGAFVLLRCVNASALLGSLLAF